MHYSSTKGIHLVWEGRQPTRINGLLLKKKRQQKCLAPIKLSTGFMVGETEWGGDSQSEDKDTEFPSSLHNHTILIY
jgi:hypothetical protein